VRVGVELDVGERDPRALCLAAGPLVDAAEHRLDARDHLGEAERLGDVVVAAERQTMDLVFGGRRAR
jgi:hypothetical protein